MKHAFALHCVTFTGFYSHLPPLPTPSRAFAAEVVGAGLLSEAEFQTLADDTLNIIELSTGALDDILDRLDISHAMGVLTLDLGVKGTYVINKQTPNKQIWWSSPISGPRRYHWDAGRGAWVGTRDGNELLATLREEVKALTGVELHFDGGGPADRTH